MRKRAKYFAVLQAALLLLLTLASLLPLCGFAESASTTITAVVSHRRTVTIHSSYGGNAEASSYSAAPGEKVIVTFRPDSGFRVQTVTMSGTDVTARLRNNTLTLTVGEEDIILDVQFAAVRTPSTGDSSALVLWCALAAGSFVLCRLLLRIKNQP